MPRKRSLRFIASSIVLLVAVVAPSVSNAASTPATPLPVDFPIGWYDGMSSATLAKQARDGMTASLGYYGTNGRPDLYLNAAQTAGVKSFVEIPRPLVKAVDVAAVRRYVSTYKGYPGLLGWYLADEPSIQQSVGPLSGPNATRLYNAIKAEDPNHPVAIAFASREDTTPYLAAFDVLMHDHYPFTAPSPEFKGLSGWGYRTSQFGAIAKRNGKAFLPVTQAFGGTNEEPVLGFRLPTPLEERYMLYSAVQAGANGLFFWVYYRSNPQWVSTVLAPLLTEMKPLRPAFVAGELPGRSSVTDATVFTSVYRDPMTGSSYLFAIHHALGTIDAPVTLAGDLASKTSATLLSNGSVVPITDGRLGQTLGSYEVKVYRID
jgi:hypothetical protein